MSTSNPTRPNAPLEESSLRDPGIPADVNGPALEDPRPKSAIDKVGVDSQTDLLDPGLDESPGDRDANGRSFADDVRSDTGVENDEPR